MYQKSEKSTYVSEESTVGKVHVGCNVVRKDVCLFVVRIQYTVLTRRVEISGSSFRTWIISIAFI